MKAFLTYLWIQFKIDIREKGTLLTFYVVPLVFFLVMGAVFSSITPEAKNTLSASMGIFAATMGAVLGIPTPFVKMKESGVLRAFRVNGIPGFAVLFIQIISAFLHLMIVSVIILVSAPLIFDAGLPQNYGMYFVSLIIFLFTSISIGVLIGVTAKSHSIATMLSQAVFLPSLMLSGIMFPTSMLPKPLIWLGNIFPSTHAMKAFSTLAYNIKTDYSGAGALTIVALTGLIAFIISIWRFQVSGRESR